MYKSQHLVQQRIIKYEDDEGKYFLDEIIFTVPGIVLLCYIKKKNDGEKRGFLQEQAINSAMYYILEKSDTGAWGTTGIIGYLYIVV